jgi:2-dehydropantoate 2-reductase
MKIVVMGSGGLGGYFGGLLAKSGQAVGFVARGEHLRALRERGLRVQSVHGDRELRDVRAAESPAELGPAELVLFCVKTFDTESAARQLRGGLAPDAAVLTLQNGLGNAEKIDEVLEAGTAMPGAAHIESAIGEPGLIVQSSPRRRITFGESDGRRSERAERILAALQAAEIEAILSEDVRRVIWEKFIFITAMAGLTSLTRRTLGEVLGFEPTRALFHGALEEGAALANAEGVGLPESVVQDVEQTAATMAPAMRSSMQKDLERGRKMEIEALNGIIVRLGRQHGIPTPVNSAIHAVLALENQGR